MPKIQAIALERMAWSRGFVESLLNGITDDQLIVRPGGTGNHALWIMGHYAVTDDQILAMMTGESETLPETFAKRFTAGSEPIDDVAAYPTRHELTTTMRSTRERMSAWVASLPESDWGTATPEALAPFATDAISVPFAIAAHDLFHAGQLATVRASLGLPRLHV
jgi:hypothetical protein